MLKSKMFFTSLPLKNQDLGEGQVEKRLSKNVEKILLLQEAFSKLFVIPIMNGCI